VKHKLTLTVDARAVENLKRMAVRRKTSVSALVEGWGARASTMVTNQGLGDRLLGLWAGRPAETDARLAYLLRKHAR
jgi:hypothetical protein